MNREIKFRAWDKKENKMFLPDYVGSETCVINVDVESSGEGNYDHCLLKYNYNIKLMQYIGLKDKNGVEIYEGDIVKCIDNSKHAVKWNENYCCFQLSNREYIGILEQDIENYEIIGNIYESPETLNQ